MAEEDGALCFIDADFCDFCDRDVERPGDEGKLGSAVVDEAEFEGFLPVHGVL